MKKVLIHSPNWLGDVIMAFPGFWRYHTENEDAEIYILAKKSVASLWTYVRGVKGIITIEKGKEGEKKAVSEIRTLSVDEAIILPGSFRSAAVVWKADVRQLRGTVGQFRFPMIRKWVSIRAFKKAHQSLEYAHILGVNTNNLPAPSEAMDAVKLPEYKGAPIAPSTLVLLPGAARGSSKRWKSSNFAAVAASALRVGFFSKVLIMGTPTEEAECNATFSHLSSVDNGVYAKDVANLCGKTNLGELTYILSKAKAVISNDSGGMHLSTWVGTPVVAVFGITDYEKTGPLGRSKVVAAKGVKRSRRIPRESDCATAALDSVKPEEVYFALKELITHGE